jgi:hypothetical protein
MTITLFWDVTPCNLTCTLKNWQSAPANVGSNLPDITASHSRRLIFYTRCLHGVRLLQIQNQTKQRPVNYQVIYFL